MNEELILDMAKPYVKNNKITYSDFDGIFSILSLKEQYEVTNILYKSGINLVDDHIENDALTFDVGTEDKSTENLKNGNFEILYDEFLFRDKYIHEGQNEDLIIHKNICQSNEILCSLIQQGSRQATQDLCIKNKRLVDKYVIAYEKRYGNHLDFEDLEQAGFIGLIKAAQKFNIHHGTFFSTYAVFWIRQGILREIMENGYAIRIPVHMMEKINKVVSAYNRLTEDEISLHKKIQQIANELGYSDDEIRECLMLKTNFLGYTSLDIPIGEDNDSELSDFIPAEEEPLEQVVLNKALRHEIETIFSTLSPREQDVLKFRFGWDNNRPKTLEEIGSRFALTRERIRQIEEKALEKLRSSSHSHHLKDFLEE